MDGSAFRLHPSKHRRPRSSTQTIPRDSFQSLRETGLSFSNKVEVIEEFQSHVCVLVCFDLINR